MTRPTLRTLLLAAVLGTMTVGFVTFGVFIDRIERNNRIDDLDVELVRAERNGFPAAPGGRPDQGPGPGGAQVQGQLDVEDASATTTTIDPPVQLLVGADGTVMIDSGAPNPFDQETVDRIIAGEGAFTVAEPRYRVRATTRPSGAVAVTALPLDDFDAAVGRFRAALAAGGGVILMLVAAVLWALTGFLARPVTRMATTANRIADGHLDTAVDPPSGSRETAELSVDLQLMLTRLRRAIDDANGSRDAMERFLADMAHEIRTPLTALKGYSDLYHNGMLATPADVDRAMSRIGSESERLADLANAMLQLASAESERLDMEAFDLAEVADEVASDLQAAYPEQCIELGVEAPGPHLIVGARAKIHQAVLNLGSNACHHNSAPQPVVITVGSADQSVALSVIDHGPGIDPADVERIFLPFYRSETARNRDGHDGSGLGLALTRQICDRHDGSLTVAPTPGTGATFTLSLPAAPN